MEFPLVPSIKNYNFEVTEVHGSLGRRLIRNAHVSPFLQVDRKEGSGDSL